MFVNLTNILCIYCVYLVVAVTVTIKLIAFVVHTYIFFTTLRNVMVLYIFKFFTPRTLIPQNELLDLNRLNMGIVFIFNPYTRIGYS